ncbi:MAG: hypothetical protein UY81_C0032G0001 [Candidatus Giovannonibacteria bacterium GW2011_GWA2_53_7]|uniref:Uncharacterized protein n=1 Tax=Candidatus Giovannonibacteria bacterium GW2011_GWA2_53_7 TaxID=1618650 RepID=A0A0G1XY42_9BACT|nr:MAG: hypothetical protein UY81_C0032G0001 [Candidatus Giovannonibacteria bacterium GW2011_GWA2_53_7]
MPETIDLAKIDLVRTRALPDLTVEIEGVGHTKVGGRASSLIEQIGHAYVMLGPCRMIQSSDHHLEKKVTIVALDVTRPYIKVRIAE